MFPKATINIFSIQKILLLNSPRQKNSIFFYFYSYFTFAENHSFKKISMIFILTSYSSKVSVVDICEFFREKIKYFKNSDMILKKIPSCIIFLSSKFYSKISRKALKLFLYHCLFVFLNSSLKI